MWDSLPRTPMKHVQNLMPLALSSVQKSSTVQTHTQNYKQTVTAISTPCLSACVNNKYTYFNGHLSPVNVGLPASVPTENLWGRSVNVFLQAGCQPATGAEVMLYNDTKWIILLQSRSERASNTVSSPNNDSNVFTWKENVFITHCSNPGLISLTTPKTCTRFCRNGTRVAPVM